MTVSDKKAKKLVEDYPDYIGKTACFGKGMLGQRVFHVVYLAQKEFKQFSLPKKTAPAMPEPKRDVVQEVIDTPDTGKSIQAGTPPEKLPQVPEELTDFVNGILEQKDAFMDAFSPGDVLKGKAAPVGFITWMKDKNQCGTDWYEAKEAKGESKDQLMADTVALYWAIIAKIEG